MTLVLDAGALIAAERGDRQIAAQIKRQRQTATPPITHGGIVGQVWRGDARHALLASALSMTTVVSLDDDLGRRSGALLAKTGGSDVLDAALVLLAADGDMILTSDPENLAALAAAAGRHVDVIPV